MAHLLAPQPPHPELPVFFNVDGVVGAPPADNRREDVMLVQFALEMIADSPLRENMDPALVAAAREVRVTGSIDAETVNAIQAFQLATRRAFDPATVVDGRVSPARGGYSYGSTWTIARLNESVQHRNRGIGPRIDRIPGCPGELQQMVARTVVGR
ncbi:MAG TPA: hypothetical protein VK849_04035 [Longimicrobiales bacterium]|nr:hypothetical protein [Longimicrobiales bacterium]